MSTHKRLMNLKTAIYILGVVLLSTFVSCLGGSDEQEIVYSPDAQITSFSIKNDSIDKELSTIKFSIDQIKGEIFNRDSARYGLVLTEKVIVTYYTASGSIARNVTNEDSVWVKSGDSIDLREPIYLLSYAATGGTKKYVVKFNTRTVDPDSIWWQQVNSDLDFLGHPDTKTVMFNGVLYCFTNYPVSPTWGYNNSTVLHISSDKGQSWGEPMYISLSLDPILSQMQQFGNELFVCSDFGKLYKANISDNFSIWTEVTSEYPVKNIFGTVAGIKVLALAVEKGGSIVSATFDGTNWKYGDKLSDALPTQDFSSLSYIRANVGRLTIAGGTVGTSWSTTDGLSWTRIGNLPSNMQGTNTFLYDGKIYLLNGFAAGNGYSRSVYTSIDGTMTWQLAPAKTNIQSRGYMARTGASVVVDNDNIIYIIGGRSAGIPVNDIWRGRLNSLN
ncbi:MAG: DUF6242 domain-containing protein [Dysgonamonadaceae bacterium]|nr:DUF6242 domain-containing protein [Dysgonamonadaceae bacterium]